jgi:hypothetical protein
VAGTPDVSACVLGTTSDPRTTISSAGVSAGVDVFLPPRSTWVEDLCGAQDRLVWSTFANRGTAEKRMRRWCRLQRLMENDPILRLHCAMQLPLAGLTDARTGRTVIAQSANPYPPHPRHPGETMPVTLDTLVRPRPAEGGSLLDLAIDNRAERGVSELEFLLAYVVRPLLRTVCAGSTGTASPCCAGMATDWASSCPLG